MRRSLPACPPRWTVPARAHSASAPGDGAVERPIEFERRRAVAVALRARRGKTTGKRSPADREHLPRRDVAHHEIGARGASHRRVRDGSRRRAARRQPASASLIACDPPRGKGHPDGVAADRQAPARSAALGRSSSGMMECAAMPANRARARGTAKRLSASARAERMACMPKRAISSGCRGTPRGGPAHRGAGAARLPQKAPSSCATRRRRDRDWRPWHR